MALIQRKAKESACQPCSAEPKQGEEKRREKVDWKKNRQPYYCSERRCVCMRVEKNGIAKREHREERLFPAGPLHYVGFISLSGPRGLLSGCWEVADETGSATALLLYPPHPSSFSSAGGCKRVSFRIFWSRRTAHYSRGQLYNYIAEFPKAFTWIGGINSIMLVYIALTLGERHSRLIHQGAAAEGLMCWFHLSEYGTQGHGDVIVLKLAFIAAVVSSSQKYRVGGVMLLWLL